MSFETTNLWRKPLESRPDDSAKEERELLAVALRDLRQRASILAEQIAICVPELTDHSVRHLDAVWEISDQIAGTEFALTPAEALVYGGAVLLHDLGNAVAAYPGGVADLQDSKWDDLVVAAYFNQHGVRPTSDQCANPPTEIYQAALLKRLREAHATKAASIATEGFFRQDGSRELVYLLGNAELRSAVGPIIGKIASSHHWDLPRVVSELGEPFGTLPGFSVEWTIDPLTLACLLRVADAAHLDSRRAPMLTRAFSKPTGESALHWDFQSQLLVPALRDDQLVYRSKGSFPAEQRDAWWLCYETLQQLSRELQQVDTVMRRHRPERRFAARSVSNVESPALLTRHVTTVGWEPVDVRPRISDVISVIDNFGGSKLYGNDLAAALRELIANAADAIRARRVTDPRPSDWGAIRVVVGKDEEKWWLEVEDNGIGMSEEVLKGPLLDFGSSYWRSDLARREHPGLISSPFDPTGVFGIGFFSIFMLGDRIRVITRPSHLGVGAIRVLEMTKGHGARPFIRERRQSEPSEGLLEGGTRVRVWLQKNPFERFGLVGKPEFDESKASEESVANAFYQELVRLVGRIAPALDAEVSCQLDSPLLRIGVAVRPNDWVDMPFSDLVERLASHKAEHGWRKSGIQSDVKRGDEVIARIGLCPPGFRLGQGGVITVGGLTAKAGVQTLDGLVVGTGPSLNRKEATAKMTVDEIVRLVRDAPSFNSRELGWTERLHFAQLFVNCGRDPEPVRCFYLPDGLASVGGVCSELASLAVGESVAFVMEDEFEYTDNVGVRREISFEKCRDRWQQHENVVLVGGQHSGEVLGDLPPGPSGWGGAYSVWKRDAPISLARFLVDRVAETWNTDGARLLANGEVKELAIGQLETDSRMSDVIVEALLISRPEEGLVA